MRGLRTGLALGFGWRTVFAFVHDVAMAAAAFVLALYLRLGDRLMEQAGPFLAYGTVIFATVAALVFLLAGLHRGIWRYASMNDLIAILRAATLVILIYLPIMFVLSRLDGMPRSALLIGWFVLIFLLGAPRFVYRVLKDRSFAHLLERDGAPRVPVLLVGAGDAAETFIREMARDAGAPFEVVGLIDPSGRSTGRRIRGVPVLGDLAAAPAALARLRRDGRAPQRLIVAEVPLGRAGMQALLDLAEAHGMSLARLPRLAELRHHDGDPVTVRPIAVADLLGRPRAVLDRAPMASLVAGRRVLVTGAGGSIGSELVSQIAALGPARLALIDHSESLLYAIEAEARRAAPGLDIVARIADVRDRPRLDRVIAAERPQLVCHAAALKHVPIAELNPGETLLTNAIGTRNLAEACRKAGVAAMVLISTDKAVNPASILGASKRLAESYCQSLDVAEAARAGGTRFLTVRFGNVLGSTGSVVPLFERQIAEGGPVTVTDPAMTRYFMTVREAVELVLQATALGLGGTLESGGIFVLDMGEPVRILDLAHQMIRLSGKRPDRDIEIVFTGLRPGEKITEEVFHSREIMAATGIPGILFARPPIADLHYWSRNFHALAEAIDSGSDEQLMPLLRRLIPEFAPATPSRSATA